MKKIFSFILLCLLAFNWFGYRFVMDCMQYNSDNKLEARLDNNAYDEARLMELKIPLHIAYQTSQSAYERIDGEIEYKGTYYKYVKRKVANDTLYLKCISNTGKASIEVAKNDFYKGTNGLNEQSKNDHSKSISVKKLLTDYDNFLFSVSSQHSASDRLSFFEKALLFSTDPSIKYPGQPPQLA